MKSTHLFDPVLRLMCGVIVLAQLTSVAQVPAPPGADLETVYQGFTPRQPGSSAQLDLNVRDRLVRFTAWTHPKADRFADYNLDLDAATVPVTTWRRTTTSSLDRVVFTIVYSSLRIRVQGDILLAPHWRGVLDVAPLDPGARMQNVPTPGAIRFLLVRAPLVASAAGALDARPMPFGAFTSVTPEVSIPNGVRSAASEIWMDDGWDETADAVPVKSLFAPMGVEARASGLPFRYGTNRLTFAFSEGSFETFSMNYDNATPAIVEAQVHLGRNRWFEMMDEAGTSQFVVKNALNVTVGEETSEEVTSSFLRLYRMRPVGLAPIIGLYNVYVHGQDLTNDDDGDGITDLRELVIASAAQDDPRSGLMQEDFQLEYDAIAENVQPSIANNTAGVNYDQLTRGWSLPAAGPPPAANGLGWAGEHFWMDTFAARRLVAAGVPAAPENFPRIGVADSGFGLENAFPNNDMPAGNFWNLWSNVGTGAGGQPVLINNQNAEQIGFQRRPVQAADFRDQKIWDVILRGHGTGVAHFVNAQGVVQKMGTGANNFVTAIKLVGLNDAGGVDRIDVFSWSAYAAAASLADNGRGGGDPTLRVFNFSNGMGILVTAAEPNAAMVAERRQHAELLFDRLARTGVAACVSARNDFRFVFPLPGAIPAGGLLVPVPGLIAPVRGNRIATTDTAGPGATDNASPLVLRCAGLTLPNAGATQETIWGPVGGRGGSGVGGNVSVAAHGNQIHSVTNLGALDFSVSGTSFSTPLVAGLLGDVIRVLDIRAGEGAPTTIIQRSARAGRVKAALEMIEATSDRVLGSNPAGNFDAAEQVPNNNMGFGRINAWKATLTAINGGLAQGGTDQGAAPLAFGTLTAAGGFPPRDAAATEWYGFLIRMQSDALAVAQRYNAATVWLNENPYDDSFATAGTLATRLNDTGANTDFTGANGGMAARNIIAFKRIDGANALNSRLPDGFSIAAGMPGTGVTEMAFSARRQTQGTEIGIASTVPGNFKRLELRRNGEAATVQPFFTIPLNLNLLRDNAGAVNGENIRFDDFVFEVLVDHFPALAVNEVRVPAGVTALAPGGERLLAVTLMNAAGGGVAGTAVNFIVSNTSTGAAVAENSTQLRLRSAEAGVGVMRTVNTDASGVASVNVGRAANPAGTAATVTGRILVRVNTNSLGGAAAGAQFPQEFTVPVRPP